MNIAVVTGASSGMGREFALQLDKENLDEIWILARRLNRLKELEENMKTSVRCLEIDLLDQKQVMDYVNLLKEVKPDVRYLVNASGLGIFGNYDEVSMPDEMHMIDLNIKTVIEMTKITLPYMSAGSRVIQLASSASFVPIPNQNVYSSSKAFVTNYSRALNYELKPRNITVTAVCPGWVRTEFFNHVKADKSPHAPVKYWPIADAEDVVSLAIKDAKKGKTVSVYGFIMNAFRALCKICSHDFVCGNMVRIQK